MSSNTLQILETELTAQEVAVRMRVIDMVSSFGPGPYIPRSFRFDDDGNFGTIEVEQEDDDMLIVSPVVGFFVDGADVITCGRRSSLTELFDPDRCPML